MKPLVHRGNAAADIGRPSGAEAPSQVPPLAEESPEASGGEQGDGRFRGDLFLPGWLKIELDPAAGEGPKG